MSERTVWATASTGSGLGSSSLSTTESRRVKYSPVRFKVSSVAKPRVCSSEALKNFDVHRRRYEKETKTDHISKSKHPRSARSRNRFRSRSSSRSRSQFRSSSRSRSRSRSLSRSAERYSKCSSQPRSPRSLEPRQMAKSKSSTSSWSVKRRRSRSFDLPSKLNDNCSSPKSWCSVSPSPINFSNGVSAELEISETGTDNSANTSSSYTRSTEFLESYICRLKSQIFFKDNKLYRLQHPRAVPKYGSDKDAVQQNNWEQHEKLYKKFEVLEKELESVTEEKLRLEIIIKKLENNAKSHAIEMRTKDSAIASLTSQVSELQLLKQTNEQLKSHYEKELGKKLEQYKQQCADFVSTSMRTYQVSNHYLQLQLISLMDNQLGHRRHEMDPMAHLKPNLSVNLGSESTPTPLAGVSSIPFPLPCYSQQQQFLLNPASTPVVCVGTNQSTVEPTVSVSTSDSCPFIVNSQATLQEKDKHNHKSDSEIKRGIGKRFAKQETSV